MGLGVYRPRHPERTGFYRILDEYFPRYVEIYEERFEPRFGPLRSVVPRTVEAFLDCGCLKNGFARLQCPQCKGEHLVALACHSYCISFDQAIKYGAHDPWRCAATRRD